MSETNYTSMGQRVFAGVMAGVFILSACAFSAFVLYDMRQSRSKSADATAASTDASQANANSSAGKPLENFTPVESVSEIQKTDTQAGDGKEVQPGDTVTVDYTGAVAATGVIFQSSKDGGQPVTFALDAVIKGWTEGIPGMKVGGTRRLIIPADLAYGANPPQGSGIPANAALVFDVTLHDTAATTEKTQQ
jgi:FKBP-type peptidyl-prolyl cis-trans isomerase